MQMFYKDISKFHVVADLETSIGENLYSTIPTLWIALSYV